MQNSWFDVDKEGLSRLIEEHGKGRLIAELLQNALDEDVTTVAITIDPLPGRPLAEVSVLDDASDGFKQLSHAYTLFADSYKKEVPTKRGRFNLGEKLVLSMCRSASISTTTGTVVFNEDGQRKIMSRTKRERGSEFRATIRMTRQECDAAIAYLNTILIPDEVQVTVNGAVIPPRSPLHAFEASLETVIADNEGVLRSRIRRTTVEVFETLPGEESSLFELGMPVVDLKDKWHVNVGQKIPLNLNRDNVRPAFLKKLRTAVFNELHDRLDSDDANSSWVQEATSDPDCSNESMVSYLGLRFGDHRVSFDPNDLEANKRAVASGATLVTGSMLNRQQWQKAKEAGAIDSAGSQFPTSKPYSSDSDAPEAECVPPDHWTTGMRNIADYARFLAKELMNVELTVQIVRTRNRFLACYGNGRLDLNIQWLGHAWFNQGPTEEIDSLLIHEFGHQYCGDHLSDEYHRALCTLGAKLKVLALENPGELARFHTASEPWNDQQ